MDQQPPEVTITKINIRAGDSSRSIVMLIIAAAIVLIAGVLWLGGPPPATSEAPENPKAEKNNLIDSVVRSMR